MMQIFLDLGSRPIVFIRFNPDAYKDNGVRVGGCFDANMNIIDEEEWRLRIYHLKDRLNVFLEDIPEKEITIEYLYYDK